MTVAVIQYELLAGHPYVHTQEDVLFLRQKGIGAAEPRWRGSQLREELLAKHLACLRASPLARRYGWSFHFDRQGRVALYAVESREYQRHSQAAAQRLKAVRTRRAPSV